MSIYIIMGLYQYCVHHLLSLPPSLPLSLPFPPLLSTIQFKATDRSYSKGDFVLKSPHVIELVTKLSSVMQETLKKKLKVVISNTYVHIICLMTYAAASSLTHT